MRKVKNKAAVKNLAVKNYKSSSKRNRMAIAAIALTTMLFAIIFTLGVGMMESIQYSSMRMTGGSAHASLKYLSKKQYEDIKDNPIIKEIGKNIVAGFVSDEKLIKRPVELNCSTEEAAKLNFVKLKEGQLPQKADEIVLDTIALDMLSIPHEPGEKIILEVDFGDRKEHFTFTLCGYYEGDAAFYSSLGYVSEEFVDENLPGRGQEYWKDKDSNGSIRADLMYQNARDIEKRTKELITGSGYEPQGEMTQQENQIAYGVNWAYMTSSMQQDTKGALLLMIPVSLLIMLSGYLIIYNVFQISVIRDIRFYGLLKTIGTTGRQVHSILIRQAMRMCCWGIPIGLLFGFLSGKLLLPSIINTYQKAEAKVTINPVIFLGASVFAVLTVLISCRKPARIAARVSPVEAVKYSGVSKRYQKQKKQKNSMHGAKPFRMAFSNLGRNRKRTVVAVISMSLSLVLMNSIFVLSGSFDMDKFVKQFISVDFQIAHAAYFNNNYGRGDEKGTVSDAAISAVESQPGFLGGGSIYTPMPADGLNAIRTKYEGTIKSPWNNDEITVEENEGLDTSVYGMDNFCLEILRILKGELDMEKLESGEGILLGTLLDDYGNIDEDFIFDVGDKIVLRSIVSWEMKDEVYNDNGELISCNFSYEYGEPKKYEVLGIYALDYTNSSRGFGDIVTAAMSTKELGRFGVPLSRMTYICNSEKNEIAKEQMEHFFKTYTEQVEPTMKYVSRENYKGQFMQMQMTVVLVGGTLCTIIGLIGVLNFINSISTSIITRKHEFAMLKSIGMTGKQLKVMLCLEGTYYGVFTLLISALVSVLFSYGVLSGLDNLLWFCSFKANFLPVISAGILLILLGALIPLICYRKEQGSIVEQLRESE